MRTSRVGALALCAALGLLNAASAAGPGADDDDAPTLRIDVGRTIVLIGRALEGLGAPLPDVLDDRPEGSELAALWRALREAGRDGIVLKEVACAKGAAPRKACRAFKAPAWIGAQPAPVPARPVLRAYADALYRRLEPFIDAGCEAGVRRAKEPMFCSVE